MALGSWVSFGLGMGVGGCLLVLPPGFPAREADGEETEAEKGAPYPGRGKGEDVAAPLESEEETHEAAGEDDGAAGVDTPEFLLQGGVGLGTGAARDDEEYCHERHKADGWISKRCQSVVDDEFRREN